MWWELIINVLSIVQSWRESYKKKRQEKEDVEIEARGFLKKYHEDMGLLPLCAIAFVYDADYPYDREMYNVFCTLKRDVRLEIFKQANQGNGWIMCDEKTDDFYGDCLQNLKKALSKCGLEGVFSNVYYENGKYVERSLLEYNKVNVHNDKVKYNQAISNLAKELFDKDKSAEIRIRAFAGCGGFYCRLGFEKEVDYCWQACEMAKQIAWRLQKDCKENLEDKYGCPGRWGYERIKTMEDLFLQTLFEIWVNLSP